MATSKNMRAWVMSLDPKSYKPLAAIGGMAQIDAWRAEAATSGFNSYVTSNGSMNLADDLRWQTFQFSAHVTINGSESQNKIVLHDTDTTWSAVTFNGGKADDIVLSVKSPSTNYHLMSKLIVNGGPGNDILMGDDVQGDEGDDLLIGTDGSNLHGGDGNDVLIAEGNATYSGSLNGGNGNDLLIGNGIIGQFYASSGTDTLIGGATSVDNLTLETRWTTGTDNVTYFRAGGGDNYVGIYSSGTVTADLRKQDIAVSDFGQIIGDGIKCINAMGTTVTLTGDRAANRLYGHGEKVCIKSGSGNDEVGVGLSYAGTSAYARADLGVGDDSLSFGAGSYQYGQTFQINAILNGGSGVDTLTLSAPTLNIEKGTFSSDFYGTGHIKNFESYILGGEDSTITGSSRAEKIDASGGDDTIRTGKGKDHVKLGKGNDTLIYEKSDVVTSRGKDMPDRILDFGKYADDYIYGPSLSVDSGPSHIPITTVDRINLNFLLEGQSYSSVDQVVHLDRDEKGTMLAVKVNGQFVDVAYLKDWYGAKASDYIQDGFLLSA